MYYLSYIDDILIPFNYKFIKINDESILNTLNIINKIYGKNQNSMIFIDSRCFKSLFYVFSKFKNVLIYNTENNKIETFLNFVNSYYFSNDVYILTNYEICLNCLFLDIFLKFYVKDLNIQFNIRDYLKIYDSMKINRNFKKDDYTHARYINLVLLRKYILSKKNGLIKSNKVSFDIKKIINVKDEMIKKINISFESLIYSLDCEIMNFKYVLIDE